MALKDISQFGFSKETQNILDELHAEGNLFAHRMDVVKVAFAVAVRDGLMPREETEASTSWNIQSLDPKGLITKFVQLRFPDDPPVRMFRGLAAAGLHRLKDLKDKDDYASVLGLDEA